MSQEGFGDFIFNCDYDRKTSTTKLREYGFHEFVDSEEMFTHLFSESSRKKAFFRIFLIHKGLRFTRHPGGSFLMIVFKQ